MTLFDSSLVARRIPSQPHPLWDAVEDSLKFRLKSIKKPFTSFHFKGSPPFDFGLPITETPDLYIDFMTLHWANDIQGALRDPLQTLSSDGLYIGVFMGGNTLHELRAAFMEAELELTGGVSPRIIPMVSLEDAARLFQGYQNPVVDKEVYTLTYPNILALFYDLRHLGLTNAMVQRPKTLTRSLIKRVGEIYGATWGTPLPATFEVIYLTGWKNLGCL